jgi:hypothetical protein
MLPERDRARSSECSTRLWPPKDRKTIRHRWSVRKRAHVVFDKSKAICQCFHPGGGGHEKVSKGGDKALCTVDFFLRSLGPLYVAYRENIFSASTELYSKSFPLLRLKITTLTSQSHKIPSSIAFFKSPFFLFKNVTCTATTVQRTSI